MTQSIDSKIAFLEYHAARDRQGRNVLQVAALRGETEVVRFLMGRGADVNKKNRYGNTPLIEAALMGHVETAAALIEGGADLEAVNRDGETPLIVAAIEQKRHVVRLLVDKGADIEKRDDRGRTALELVRSVNFPVMVQLLEEAQDIRRHEAAVQKQKKLNSAAPRPRLIRKVQP